MSNLPTSVEFHEEGPREEDPAVGAELDASGARGGLARGAASASGGGTAPRGGVISGHS